MFSSNQAINHFLWQLHKIYNSINQLISSCLVGRRLMPKATGELLHFRAVRTTGLSLDSFPLGVEVHDIDGLLRHPFFYLVRVDTKRSKEKMKEKRRKKKKKEEKGKKKKKRRAEQSR